MQPDATATDAVPSPDDVPTSPSSRQSDAGAGWDDDSGPGSWAARVPPGTRPMSWLRPSILWQSRNDVLARWLGDPTEAARVAWMKVADDRAKQAGASTDHVVTRSQGPVTTFLVLGDTGEGDASQFALTPDLVAHSADADFAFICSDVIYPTGDIADYLGKFALPYRDLMVPIFAVPGNHDWYDGLHGFMHHICGLDASGPLARTGRLLPRTLRGALWRRSPAVAADQLAAIKALRASPRQHLPAPQPAPYFAIDIGPIRLVGIDTGIRGEIDAAQGEWLERVSTGSPRPKILLTGKPLVVDNECHSGVIAGRKETVDDIVRRADTNYVAAIGGDIHNYQRYPITLDDGRVIQYVVSGGGGAFMHATHQIPRVTVEGTSEDAFRCYPLRGDSLRRYSELYDRRFAGGRGWLALDSREAATVISERYGIPPTRSAPVDLSKTKRGLAAVIRRLPATQAFHRHFSEFFDWDDPPMFKHFLRVDTTSSSVRISCLGVTGCASHEGAPSVEDEFTITW